MNQVGSATSPPRTWYHARWAAIVGAAAVIALLFFGGFALGRTTAPDAFGRGGRMPFGWNDGRGMMGPGAGQGQVRPGMGQVRPGMGHRWGDRDCQGRGWKRQAPSPAPTAMPDQSTVPQSL